MQRISEVGDRELAWKGSGCRKAEYELCTGDEVVARLCWQRGSLAIAETAESRWSFKRPGFRRSRVSVREVGSGADMATFVSGWGASGVLQTPQQRHFKWSAANLWRSRWMWQDSGGTLLVRFQRRQGIVKLEGRVEIEEAAITLSELDLLVVLGWYLLVVGAQDSTTDAVISTAAIAGS